MTTAVPPATPDVPRQPTSPSVSLPASGSTPRSVPQPALRSATRPAPRQPVAVWPWPIALGLLTSFGLLSALLGQHGIWLALSWVSLSIPLVVTTVCLIRAWSRPSSKGGLS